MIDMPIGALKSPRQQVYIKVNWFTSPKVTYIDYIGDAGVVN